MTIGVLAALGQPQLLEIQFRSALERGELTEEQVREMRRPPDPLHRVAAVHRGQRGGRAGHRPPRQGRSSSTSPGAVTGRPDGPLRLLRQGGHRHRRRRRHRAGLRRGAGRGRGRGDGGRHRRGEGGRVAAAIVASGGTAESVRVDVADPDSARAMAEADRRAVRRHRLPGQQRRHLRRHEARPAAHRGLGVPQPVPRRSTCSARSTASGPATRP